MAGDRAGESWYRRIGGEVPARPALMGRVEAETCIVGGGLAGLGVALSLAERGRPGLLLEAGRIGDGASGRNGGMASAGFTRGHGFVAARAGAASADALYRLSLDGLALLRRRIGRHAIACGLAEGVVEASWRHDAGELERSAEPLRALGGRLEVWPEDRLREAYRSPCYRAGLLDRDGFHLDPLALCRSLADAAGVMGGALHEDSPATGLAPAGGGWRVRTAGGEVLARRVVLCTSADRPALAPALDRAVLPIRSHIVVTEPLGDRLAEAVAAPHAVYDDRLATGYYRPLAGGRLLWGGRVDALPGPRSVEAALRRDLALVFPQLAEVPFATAWSGAMGFVRHRMPVVRPLAEGLWVATGFGGHGLNTTTLAGELVASALVEGDRRWRLLDAFGLPWNGGPLGPLAAQAFYRAFQLRDAAARLTGSKR
ncbi:MAG TPA: FAD-dependent oxidoreductase [Geminicoccaceae bacterium]|nr:FAD-dependent oxidoreductase [Geminicoccus sp.]HMU50791.1 FAD-dependent oxidoreductase [Geminicoccaceae bacterium]